MTRHELELDRRISRLPPLPSERQLIEAAIDWRDNGCPKHGAIHEHLMLSIDLAADDRALLRQQMSDQLSDEDAADAHIGRAAE